MTFKRKYMYNDVDSGISNKRFVELVSLGETVCRSFIIDYVNDPGTWFSSLENLKSGILRISVTHIGISVKASKNRKIRTIEEKIVADAALNLFEEFCAFKGES